MTMQRRVLIEKRMLADTNNVEFSLKFEETDINSNTINSNTIDTFASHREALEFVSWNPYWVHDIELDFVDSTDTEVV